MNRKRFKSNPHRPKIFTAILLAAYCGLVACTVNSGNPTGKKAPTQQPSTTLSVYLQSPGVAGVDDLLIHVRGLRLLGSSDLAEPASGTFEELLFDTTQSMDMMDYKSQSQVRAFDNHAVTFRDYKQVRLLFDEAGAGEAELNTGNKKSVLAIPLDFYANSSAADGSHQGDQISLRSDQSLLQEGEANSIVISLDLSEIIAGPEALDAKSTAYFSNKGLSHDSLAQAVFLKPVQSTKTGIYQMNAVGVLDGDFGAKMPSGLMCVYPASAQTSLAARLATLTSACDGATMALTIRGSRTIISLPVGEYVGLVFDEQSHQVGMGLQPFVIKSGDNTLQFAVP
jgi:hypothetical protein